ncbi:MAG: CHAD domain-containing protein [Thiovulaceae bacterium]|nr:CHAD domain-containing protein [Sulfurimonadaceae bacterium]MDD3816458.1 CHAD domain-containing protein [Sulfurimonadaceae bacterium]
MALLMQPHAMDAKLQEFDKTLKRYLSPKGIKSIELHALRLKTRELYSLLASEESFAKEVKKILKYSNSLRDMDVFEEVYLASLPKKYRTRLPMEQIQARLEEEREADREALESYLASFRMPQKVSFALEKKREDAVLPKLPEYEKKELHRYRIAVKKMLAQEKNREGGNKEKIVYLTQLKDILGTMNDNANALVRLKRYLGKTKLFMRLKRRGAKENKKLYKKLKKLTQGKNDA